MPGTKKRRNTPGNNSKQSKPRRGEQTKPANEAKAKEMETKQSRQTKLAFAPGTTPSTKTPPSTTTTQSPQDTEVWTKVQKKKLSFAQVGTPPKADKVDNNKSAANLEESRAHAETPTKADKVDTTAATLTAVTPEPKTRQPETTPGPTPETETAKKTQTRTNPPKTTAKDTTQEKLNHDNTGTNNKQKEANESSDDDNKKPAALKSRRSDKRNRATETTTTKHKEKSTYNSPTQYMAI